MPTTPATVATVRVTADDINGNNSTKQFNFVGALNFDFNKGMVNIVDATGSFYFSLVDMVSVTYTIAGGVEGGVVTVVMS